MLNALNIISFKNSQPLKPSVRQDHMINKNSEYNKEEYKKEESNVQNLMDNQNDSKHKINFLA